MLLLFQSAAPTVLIEPTTEIGFGISLIEPGPSTAEGVLIASVTPAWGRFIKMLIEDAQAFMRLDARQMEELIAGAYEKAGWNVTLTPRSGDGGKDIVAVRHDVGSIRVLDQVKRYKPGHLVSAEEVRAMWAVLDRDRRASKGLITTTSNFAPGVYKDFADSMPTRIEFRNGQQVREWLVQLAS